MKATIGLFYWLTSKSMLTSNQQFVFAIEGRLKGLALKIAKIEACTYVWFIYNNSRDCFLAHCPPCLSWPSSFFPLKLLVYFNHFWRDIFWTIKIKLLKWNIHICMFIFNKLYLKHLQCHGGLKIYTMLMLEN